MLVGSQLRPAISGSLCIRFTAQDLPETARQTSCFCTPAAQETRNDDTYQFACSRFPDSQRPPF